MSTSDIARIKTLGKRLDAYTANKSIQDRDKADKGPGDVRRIEVPGTSRVAKVSNLFSLAIDRLYSDGPFHFMPS